MTARTVAFWADDGYDREAASDGRSRLGAYLRRSVGDGELSACWDDTFTEADDRAKEFVAAVWPLACAPVMAPGYVRWHWRVIDAKVRASDWDGRLLAAVKLTAPQPLDLSNKLRSSSERAWWDRPIEHWGDVVQAAQPSDEDLARRRYMTCDLNLEFALELAELPDAPAGPEDDVEARARWALHVTVAALCDAVEPVLEALEATE